MSSWPYAAAMESRIRDSIAHMAQVDIYPATGPSFQLDVRELTVDFDESWSPRGQARFAAAVPADPAHRLALDGRRAARVQVSLGYLDGSPDIHLAGDMVLQSAAQSFPGDTLAMSAVTDEILAQQDLYRAGDGTPPATGVVEYVSWLIRKAVGPYVPAITSPGISAAWRPWLVQGIALEAGMTYWSIIEEVALRAGLYVYATGPRDWVITLRSRISSAPVSVLRTGDRGIITAVSETVNRAEWHNSVFLRYRWRDTAGTDRELVASRTATSGPYAAAAVGRKTFLRDVAMEATAEQADAAALELLQAVLARGASYTVDAIAAYWLRPGMTVTVRLPTGTVAQVIVARVQFRPLEGLMTITTKSPADITTTS